MKKPDIGLVWAYCVNIWGQVSIPQSILNTIMAAGTFYAVSMKQFLPLWVYILILLGCMAGMVIFVVTIGISGYYKFFNQKSYVERIYHNQEQQNKRLMRIEKALGIDDESI